MPRYCSVICGQGSRQLVEPLCAVHVSVIHSNNCVHLQYGEDAIKEGMGSGGGGGGMGDIFDILSGGGRRQQPRERRGENVVHRLKVSLEEMYSGAVRKLSLSRNIKCDTCGGSGTKSGKRYQCDVRHQHFQQAFCSSVTLFSSNLPLSCTVLVLQSVASPAVLLVDWQVSAPVPQFTFSQHESSPAGLARCIYPKAPQCTGAIML